MRSFFQMESAYGATEGEATPGIQDLYTSGEPRIRTVRAAAARKIPLPAAEVSAAAEIRTFLAAALLDHLSLVLLSSHCEWILFPRCWPTATPRVLVWRADQVSMTCSPRRVDLVPATWYWASVRKAKREADHRIFRCRACLAMVVVCRSCDRGQRYCSPLCAREKRQHRVREAGRRYQQTARGREAGATRQRRWRERRRRSQDAVTHPSTETRGPSARPHEQLGALSQNVQARASAFRVDRVQVRCTLCGLECTGFSTFRLPQPCRPHRAHLEPPLAVALG